MRTDITKELLEELYLEQLLNPYEIAEQLNCNHKTIRNRLKAYNITMRTASEYNYLPRKSHTSPTDEQLTTNLSTAGHIAYLCEGWHTRNATSFHFCNTEASLIDMMIRFLTEIYQVRTIRLQIISATEEEAEALQSLYPEAKVILEDGRVTPLVRLFSGGKNLVREVIENGYQLLGSLS